MDLRYNQGSSSYVFDIGFALSGALIMLKIMKSDKTFFLFDCLKYRYNDIVKYLIESYKDVNITDENRLTLLMVSTHNGNQEMVTFLIENNAEVNYANNGGWTALFFAALNGDFNCVQYLIQNNAEVNHSDIDGITALLYAADQGHVYCVEYLVQNNANVNLSDNDGNTAMFRAAHNSHLHCVKILIKSNANVNHTNKYGQTALMFAAVTGDFNCVQYLMQNNATVNISDNDGITALFLAVLNSHLDCVKILIQNNANVNHTNKNGRTALFYAAGHGHLNCVEYIIQNNAIVNISDNDGNTALFLAAQCGHLDCVKILIESNGNINHTNKNGLTALFYAAGHGHLNCVKHLIQNNAIVNISDNDGNTALFSAAQCGHLDCVKILIESNGNLNHTNKRGQTALFSAAQNGHLACVKYLIKNNANTCILRNGITFSAVTYATSKGHLECVQFILKQEARDTESFRRSLYDLNSLGLAASEGHVNVLIAIIKARYNKNFFEEEIIRDANDTDFGNILLLHIENMKKCCKIMKDLKQMRIDEIDDETMRVYIHKIKNRIADLYYLNKQKDKLSIYLTEKEKRSEILSTIKGMILSQENEAIMITLQIQDRVLGKGSFGLVKLGTTRDNNYQQVAVKCYNLQENIETLSLLNQETDCLQKLQHDNLVRFFGHKMEFDYNLEKTMIYIVTELCCEDLYNFYVKDGCQNERNPSQAKTFESSLLQFVNHVIQILSGMEYIHSQSYVHKDMKLKNILLSFDHKAKICDFGLADILKGEVQETYHFKGTKLYSAPEVLRAPCRYSSASDQFSVGLLMVEMYCGQLYYKLDPFDTASRYNVIEMLKSGTTPGIGEPKREIEKVVASIVNGCLEYDYDKRLSAKNAKGRFEEVLKELHSENPDLKPLQKSEFNFPDISETVMDLISRTLTSRDYVQPASILFKDFESASGLMK